jgi:hypothetical protein
MNRRFQQPYALSPSYLRGIALQMEAMAAGRSASEILRRLEDDGVFLRVDPTAPATMLRGAIVGEGELALLRRIEQVVRLGRVRRISRTEIAMEHGAIPTSERTLHVHCAARGLGARLPRPVFEPGRITLQPFAWGYACLQYATIAVVEATVPDDAEKNRLCPPLRYWNEDVDYLRAFLAMMVGGRARGEHAALRAWTKSTRLNPSNAASGDEPVAVAARETIRRVGPEAAANLARILAA